MINDFIQAHIERSNYFRIEFERVIVDDFKFLFINIKSNQKSEYKLDLLIEKNMLIELNCNSKLNNKYNEKIFMDNLNFNDIFYNKSSAIFNYNESLYAKILTDHSILSIAHTPKEFKITVNDLNDENKKYVKKFKQKSFNYNELQTNFLINVSNYIETTEKTKSEMTDFNFNKLKKEFFIIPDTPHS